MKSKLFDENIPARCEYCEFVREKEGRLVCVKNKAEAKEPCSGYRYDPTMRVPRAQARLPEYSPEDFFCG